MAEESRVPVADPAQFAHDFPDVAAAVQGRITGTAVAASPEAQRYRMLINEVFDIEEARGIVPATVINMNPFPLYVNGVLFDDLVCPPCPEGADYVEYHIPMWKMDKKDLGDGVYIPYAEPPLKLAYDFEREFYEQGGVFFFPGIFRLEEVMDKQVKRNVKGEAPVVIGDLFEQAKARLIKYSWSKYHEAENEWRRPNGQRSIINQIHRRAVVVLIKFGELKEKPEWVAMKPNEGKQIKKCQSCTADCESGALICAKCGYVFDVVKAYDLGMIEPEPRHMRRMTPEQLEERNLNPADYIAGYKADEPGDSKSKNKK